MGIDSRAILIYGVPADEIEYDEEEFDGLYEYVEAKELDYSSPHYDAGIDNGIIGVALVYSDYYSASEVDHELLPDALEKAAKDFKERTGLDGKLYLSPHIT